MKLEVQDPLLAHYAVIRSYVEHEDRLIGERISRTLLAHGFLIASFVLLVQARIGAASQCLARDKGCASREVIALLRAQPNGAEQIAQLSGPDELAGFLVLAEFILPFIAFIGYTAAGSAHRGVQAAEKAIDSVRAIWQQSTTVRDAGGVDALRERGLPPMTNGGHPDLESGKFGSISRQLLFHLRLLWGGMFAASVGSLFLASHSSTFQALKLLFR